MTQPHHDSFDALAAKPAQLPHAVEHLGASPCATAVMGAREFCDDDAGYVAWLAIHPDGYVINIARSHNPTTARVHHSYCRTINGINPHEGPWTGPYKKVCAQHLTDLQQWTSDHVYQPIRPCGVCHPTSHTARPVPNRQGRFKVHGPAAVGAVVEAWADDYIRFEHLPDWQKRLRTEIKARCRQLEPSAGQVLHATYFGDKHPNADVENLVLYNIDSFSVAGRNGIRFEHGATVPPTPDGAKYPFRYRYALAPKSGAFATWQQGRTLASFDWTDLGAFAGEKKLAQVWLALARAEVEVFAPAAPETPFALKLQVRPPRGQQPLWGNLVKGIFDGVICAFQAHTDTTVVPQVVTRIATALPVDPAEIAEHLLDQRRAVLGVARQLVAPYRQGVKWDPADHLCVAGELLAAEPVDERWAIKGELVILSR